MAVLIAAVIAGVVVTLGTDISSALQSFVSAF
jgi:Flp pilus assembly pilin Flp